MKINTKRMTTTGILCAFAYIAMLISKPIPEVAGFLQFDVKDVIIVTGGFILGPLNAFVISLIVSTLELFSVSDTGIIGLIMNVISTSAFCCTASFVYKYLRTFKGAILSLVLGTVTMAGVMILWNYFITPVYMKVPREVVVSMLLPVFLPFNLLKGLINSGLTMVLYRPLVLALSGSGLIKSQTAQKSGRAMSPSLIIGAVVLAVGIPLFLKLLGLI